MAFQISKIFEGKSPTEKKKIIVAAVFGVLSVTVLLYAFGPGLFRSSATVRVTASPTPQAPVGQTRKFDTAGMPSRDALFFEYTSTPVVYDRGGIHSASEPGRNIFAFYEPPIPCKPGEPECATPIKTPPPTPTPTPHPIAVNFINPQSVYAGSRGFRLDISGGPFDETARVYFNQNELRTTLVSPERLAADVPANMITTEGSRQIIVQTLDGTKYSKAVMLTVQAPPKPQFLYIGMLGRKRFNNDTAYFREEGQNKPEFSARLNDVVGGRFRLVSVSSEETVLEDVNLGFRHKIKLFRPAPGTALPGGPPIRGTIPGRGEYIPFNPNTNMAVPVQSIPGIPDNIPRWTPPSNANVQRPQQKQKDDDDEDDEKP